jgi:NTP pyrophosphatase (non-canonical NTP hydrolase)
MNEPDLLTKIRRINQELQARFPGGHDPFQMATRLLEEAGELAAQINHFENSGVKRAKHGEPDPMKLAKEVQDVIRCALQIAGHYGIEAELAASVDRSYRQVQDGSLTQRYD